MWFSEWLDPNRLEYWPFGILTENTILSTANTEQIVGNGTLPFYSAESLRTQGE